MVNFTNIAFKDLIEILGDIRDKVDEALLDIAKATQREDIAGYFSLFFPERQAYVISPEFFGNDNSSRKNNHDRRNHGSHYFCCDTLSRDIFTEYGDKRFIPETLSRQQGNSGKGSCVAGILVQNCQRETLIFCFSAKNLDDKQSEALLLLVCVKLKFMWLGTAKSIASHSGNGFFLENWGK